MRHIMGKSHFAFWFLGNLEAHDFIFIPAPSLSQVLCPNEIYRSLCLLERKQKEGLVSCVFHDSSHLWSLATAWESPEAQRDRLCVSPFGRGSKICLSASCGKASLRTALQVQVCDPLLNPAGARDGAVSVNKGQLCCSPVPYRKRPFRPKPSKSQQCLTHPEFYQEEGILRALSKQFL